MTTSTSTDGQTTESNATGENQQTTDSKVRDPDAVLAKNRELLGNNKKLSTKLTDMEETLKGLQDDKSISEGQKDQVIERLRSENKTLKSDMTSLEDTYNWNTVESQLKLAASKEGCTDADKLVKLIDDSDLSALQVDGKFRVNNDDLTGLLTKVKKDNPFLFTEGSANINDLTPSNNIKKSDPKPISKLSNDEIIERLMALDKQERS